MKPTQTLAAAIATLLATDTGTIAHGTNAVKVGLILNDFDEDVETVVGDLTIATATGLAAISGVVGNQLESVDPVSGYREVEIKVPAGGFRWETPGDYAATDTVYGFALMNSTAATLYGTHKLETPIDLDGPNQSITAPELKFTFDPSEIY